MYDPVIGRFISPDNLLPDLYDPQALNRYSYCRNNPLIYVDPTGHLDRLPEHVVETVLPGNSGRSSISDWLNELARAHNLSWNMFMLLWGPQVANAAPPTTGAAKNSNRIGPSNYDPNNTDRAYRAAAIAAAKDYLLDKTGVDASNTKMPWVNAVGLAGDTDFMGNVRIFNAAFESFEYLAAIIGHEQIHVDQGKMGYTAMRGTQLHYALEVVAYDWMIDKASELGITDLIGSADKYGTIQYWHDTYLNALDETYEGRYRSGEFNPYKSED